MSDELPTPEEILATHQELEEVYEMTYTGIRASNPEMKLRRIVDAACDAEGVFQRAAILLRRLISAHIFEDGNKRTAWVTTRQYLAAHGQEPAD